MEDLIPNKCNYENLLSYKKTKLIFELTYYFCHTYLSKGDRTIDQMIQAARSGKQNIVEGCAASPTSAKTEIRLISVAKASLQELLEYFKDYLSTHNHRQWEMDSKEMAAMRRIGKEHTDANFFMEIAKTRPPETIANMAIVLIKQADFLLFRQLKTLSDKFKNEGTHLGAKQEITSIDSPNQRPYSSPPPQKKQKRAETVASARLFCLQKRLFHDNFLNNIVGTHDVETCCHAGADVGAYQCA